MALEKQEEGHAVDIRVNETCQEDDALCGCLFDEARVTRTVLLEQCDDWRSHEISLATTFFYCASGCVDSARLPSADDHG